MISNEIYLGLLIAIVVVQVVVIRTFGQYRHQDLLSPDVLERIEKEGTRAARWNNGSLIVALVLIVTVTALRFWK